MAKEHHYTWTWDLKASPEALWPLVSDTNRFNRDTGLPPMELLGINNGVKLVKFKVPIVRVEWDEEPFEWTYPYRFGILRRYRTGPLKEMRVDCRLERLGKGTRLFYQVWATAKNILGEPAILIVIGAFSAYMFEKVFHEYDKIASLNMKVLTFSNKPNLSAGGRSRFKLLSEPIKKQTGETVAIDKLYDYLDHADNLSIQRMRPYALADGWDSPRRSVLETFLRATRAGIVDMYWDILCPSCRGVAADHVHLGDVNADIHCNTCQIDFKANFDHNVEVIFRPNSAVRSVDSQVEFCVGSPQRQPHKVFSLIVPAGEELPFTTVLNEGRYSLRVPGISGQLLFNATKGGAARIEIRAEESKWPDGVVETSLNPYINLINATSQVLTFDLERTAWSDQAATAADVTTLQVFRDLFSTEVLRPGEEISVGSTTLMFTDLRKSTSLYRQIGDAPAFGIVREHFEVLEKAISDEGGSIVKVMGDSVMSTFRKPVSALRAVWNAERIIFQKNDPPLQLKAGIHRGPCIVVNLDNRLDYFGTTANIAARLPHFSNGGEAIFSESIHHDPEVIEFLERNAAPNSVSRFKSEIRGYDTTMELWRFKM